jgi:hypothetical protein
MRIYVLLLFYYFLSGWTSYAWSPEENLLLHYPFSIDTLNYASGIGVANGNFVNGGQLDSTNYGYTDSHGSLLLHSASSQYFQINSFTTGNNGLSFAFWFKSNNNPTWSRVFEFGNGPDTNNIFFAPGETQFWIHIGGPAYAIPAPPACNTNVWCFIVVTMTYSTTLTGSHWVLYHDGEEYDNKQNPYPAAASRSLNYFGKSNYADPYYEGLIGEFRLYQSVLTPGQVQTLYSGSSLKYGLVAYYPFDSNINDASGNGNTGSGVGSISYTSNRNAVAGGAIQFDGTNYIQVPGW